MCAGLLLVMAPLAARAQSVSISGMVVDEQNTPVRKAVVWLSRDQVTAKTTTTDADGRFAFGAVSPGSFTLSASKAAYTTARYGAKRPGRPGTTLVIEPGRSLTDVRLLLAHGGAIAGTIRNVLGEPMPASSVRAHRRSDPGRGFEPFGIEVMTDDRGTYRLFGLEPGEYIVSAVSQTRTIRVVTESEVDAAMRAVESPAAPAAQTAGAAPAASRSMAMAPIYFPGTPAVANASVIAIDAGVERSGIDIRLDLVPTITIEGIVNRADGQPAKAPLLRLRDMSNGPNTLFRVADRDIRGDGTFTITGIPPGEYLLVARTTSAPVWTATVPVVAGEAGALGVTVTLRPPLVMNGRLVADGLPAPPVLATAVLAPLAGPAYQTGQRQSVRTNDAGQFKFEDVMPGRYALQLQPPAGPAGDGWAIAGLLVNGRSMTGEFEIAGSEPTLDVTMMVTTRAASVHGTLVDAAGAPAPGNTVVIFSTERAWWGPESTRVKAAQTLSNGTYRMTGLLPGDYFVAAAADPDPNQWFDPAFLAQLALAASRITIAEAEDKTQDLRIR